VRETAERRMFSKKIVESDAFLDMPLSTQALYFHLSMEADDDGFVNNPRKIQRMLGASDDDLKLLLAKNFLISFESGVVVVKHWKIHNYIRGDRKKATIYQEEASFLEVNSNNEYKLSKDIPAMEIPIAPNEEKEETLRQQAYKKSSLPYSFNYKIKRFFYGEKCPICGVRMTDEYNLTKPSIQHNIPISKGGKHELGNISITCLSCNTSIKNNVTGDLNSDKVCEAWDRIVDAERKGIDWFMNPSILGTLGDCQSNDGQMSVDCQSNDGIGKDSIGKVSLGKDSLGEVSVGKDSVNTSVEPHEPKERIRYQEIADMYNSICVSLPRLQTFSDGRKKSAKRIIDEYGIDTLRKCFEMAEESDFLSGRKTNWKASFDWLIKPANFVKVIDGNYLNEKKQQPSLDDNFRLPGGQIDWDAFDEWANEVDREIEERRKQSDS